MNKIHSLFLSLCLLNLACSKTGGSDPSHLTATATEIMPMVPEGPLVCQNEEQKGTRPKGLKPITKEELRKLKPLERVAPNELGLKRINQERKRRGLQELEETSENLGAALPATIDNSVLAAFPPIGQQGLNNCVGWAMGYYQWSHNTALAMGWNNKTSTSKRCSPKFVYNLINQGVDEGAYFSDAFNLVHKHGCISWDQLPEDRDYLGWSTNPDHWQAAISYRTNLAQYIRSVDTATGLESVKQLLNNGYVLTFGTYIDSWQFTAIKANPSAPANPLLGQPVLRYMNGIQGGHAMTIVGYDDQAWTDINQNNLLDAGELGVLKIANSWGTSWKSKGFAYVAYDALKDVSGVAGGPAESRQPAFQGKIVYHMPVKASQGVAYRPKYLAKFSLSHGLRDQVAINFGLSSKEESSPTASVIPFALVNNGGAHPVSGSFVMDISELPITNTEESKFYLSVTDNKAGNPATLASFEVIDVDSSTQAATSELASFASIDGSTKSFALKFDPVRVPIAPTAVFIASVTSGSAPVEVTFDASESYDQDSALSSYMWSFGDGTMASGSIASKTYTKAGKYTVTLTVKDSDGITASASRVISVTEATIACE